MSSTHRYIIVDDDPFNNTICRMQIERTLGNVDIRTFEIPEEGLAFIKNEYTDDLTPTTLFLDLNMPSLTGWEFLEEFQQFGEDVKNQISIYILSSSVDPRDKEKANANKYIKGFMSKPLNRESILSIGT